MTTRVHISYNSFRHILISLLGLCLLTSLIGCSSSDETPTPRLSEQEYYEAAQRAMDGSNYLIAIEQLEQLESRYPFGRYTKQAQLDLIYSYYKSLEYETAAVHAERFIRLNPGHPNIDYAYYLRGLALYSVDRGILARFLPTSPSERDISPISSAYEAFKQLIDKYPKSRYAQDARQRLIYLRNVLAEHELIVARYYIKRRAYLAAVNRAKYVVENLQGSPAVADGLAIMVEAYRYMSLDDLADSAEKNLAHNFPSYHGLNDQGSLKLNKTIQNDERSWLNLLTFGLLG